MVDGSGADMRQKLKQKQAMWMREREVSNQMQEMDSGQPSA